jgi:16S rRNA (guanine527-N7)-methyltransferase
MDAALTLKDILSSTDASILYQEFTRLNISLSPEKERQLLTYMNLLQEWNQNINLTAIADYKGIIFRHMLDSLTICSVLDLEKVKTLIDIGSGAGLPGLMLKIAFPHLETSLIESRKKKANFIAEAIKACQLKNTISLPVRSESIRGQKQADIVCARAVAKLSKLLPWAVPLLKPAGRFVAYKQNEVTQELAEAKPVMQSLNCELVYNKQLKVFDGQEYVARRLLVFRCRP